MNELTMLQGEQTRAILQTLIDRKVPAIMTYSVGHKWHAAKISLAELGAARLTSLIPLSENARPINVQPGQAVGISVKHEYGKFIFETTVVCVEPPTEIGVGGSIVFSMPEKIEIVQRRSYFRVEVPESLKVDVQLWHHGYMIAQDEVPIERCWQGELVDISAGGAQVAISRGQEADLRKGQYVSMRFTPLPYEQPLVLNAQIRAMLPTADGESICLGLQMVGLEASREGREVLSRLVGVVEQYYQINKSSARTQDFQTTAHEVSQGRD